MQIGYISKNELPVFENLLSSDVVQSIKKNMAVTALGISVEGMAIGAIAGYIDDEIFKIMSLFISPDYRRRGYATSLIKELRLLLKLYSDIKDMELSFTVSHKEHELFITFLEKFGFIKESNFGRNLYMLSMEKLIQSSLAKEGKLITSREFLPFGEISELQLYELSKKAELHNVPLPVKTLTDPSILRDISFVHRKDGIIDAFITFNYLFGNKLTLSCVWIDSDSAAVLPLLLQRALKIIMENYSQEEVVFIQTVNDSSTRLLKKLFPECVSVSYTYHYHFPYIADWRY